LAAACLLSVSMIFIYGVGRIALAADRAKAEEMAALSRLQSFFSHLQDAETGQRGFLLTGGELHIRTYTNGLSQIQIDLNQLRQLSQSGLLPGDGVERLASLTRQKLDELARTVQLREDKGLPAALAIVGNNSGQMYMDQIREEISRMQAEGQNLLQEQTRRARRSVWLQTATFAGVGLLNLLFLGWAFGTVSREVALREAAVLETQRDRELLSITLASIGDAVIVTNAKGTITFVNAEAEKLTGWRSSEAKGQTLTKIFQIVNEQTLQPAENPVDKVLRSGTTVGLANHTLLISRNGAEIPIDDSAAPIRHPDSSLFGVVLVFRDFTAARRAQQTLEQNKTELEKLVAERTAKLREMVEELQHVSYAISHDMRAPLRAMSAFAALLSETTAADKNQETEEYCRRIQRAAARLDKLITDALHYTKAVLREMPPEPVDLSKLVPGLLETYPNLQPDKADIRIDGQLPVVLGNEAVLAQCFSNLLGNAVKFVAPGTRPRVRVSAEILGTMTRIWIEDNGIGFSPHFTPRLFKMFQRLTTEYEGTGVGLAIVRKFVERMGGMVGAKSEPGQGSRFWMELPLAADSRG
jgi:PAS domain S-box-containing protein